jgi:hypothetical protein
MRAVLAPGIVLLALAAALAAGCAQRGEGAPPPGADIAKSAEDLFGDTLIPRFDLELTPEAMTALAAEPKKWQRGTFRYGGVVYADVAVRLKGNRSRRGFSGKPAFKVRFDKYVKGRTFLGLRELVLNNLVEDPTMVREALAYRLHRELGVAAPRTGWADVWLNGERLGIYLDVEAPDEQLLRRVYGDGAEKGNLYEGEFGCDLYPDDAPRFEQDGGEDESHADIVALAELAHARPEALYAPDGPIDVERVVAFLAVSTVVGDFDGYRHSHNYRLYHDPVAGRWSLLPWGQDRTFKKRLDPLDSSGLLARRCFADAACRAAYATALERAAAKLEALVASGVVDRWIAVTDAVARGDTRKPYGGKTTREARTALRRFLAERPGEIRAAVACLQPDAPPSCARPLDPRCEPFEAGGVRFELCARPMTWSEAEATCVARGLHLARIDDAAQADALAAAARERSKERWWIGLHDRAAEGTPAWVDGSPVTYTRWAKGQPDDAACGEDCAALKVKTGATWSDAHCEMRRPFICR